MKKFILVLSLIAMLMLVGCDSNEINQPQDMTNNNQIENVEQASGEKNTADDEVNSTEDAKTAILNALKDSEWVKENVSMKETCFGDEFVGNQELTFEILGDDLAVVQAYAYDSNEGNRYDFGVQVFLVGYSDGELKVKSLPEEGPAHPGHGGFSIDSSNMVLVDSWMHQGSNKYTAYKISNLMFEEIESFSFKSDDENYEEIMKKVEEFNQKYETHQIEKKLTEENLNNEN